MGSASMPLTTSNSSESSNDFFFKSLNPRESPEHFSDYWLKGQVTSVVFVLHESLRLFQYPPKVESYHGNTSQSYGPGFLMLAHLKKLCISGSGTTKLRIYSQYSDEILVLKSLKGSDYTLGLCVLCMNFYRSYRSLFVIADCLIAR